MCNYDIMWINEGIQAHTSLALFMLFLPYLIALQHAVFDTLTTCYRLASSIAETVYQYCTVNVVKVSVHACANQDMELGAPIQACSCEELLIVYKVASLLHAPPLHLHKFSAGKLLVAFTLVQCTTVLSSIVSWAHCIYMNPWRRSDSSLTALCDSVSSEEQWCYWVPDPWRQWMSLVLVFPPTPYLHWSYTQCVNNVVRLIITSIRI